MLCEQCNEQEATVHMTRYINGNKTEIHLCQECARNRGDINIFNPFTINDLLSEFLDMVSHPTDSGVSGDIKCDSCGMTYSRFRKLGRLGCEDCYRYFNRELDPVVNKIQGGPRHTGKVPSRMGFSYRLKREIEQLRGKLLDAVETEAFEKAANYRDEIRELERELKRWQEEGA